MTEPAILPPPPFLFFLIAVVLSLLLALAELVAAFRESAYSLVRAVWHPWALALYAFYGLLTLILGLIVLETGLFDYSWTAAVALGLGGPILLRSRIHLFRPLGEAREGAALHLEKIVGGVQDFCFAQINDSLAWKRIRRKEALAQQDEEYLLRRLRAVYGQEFGKIEALLNEQRQQAPASVKWLMVNLLEAKDPKALDQPLEGEQTPPE